LKAWQRKELEIAIVSKEEREKQLATNIRSVVKDETTVANLMNAFQRNSLVVDSRPLLEQDGIVWEPSYETFKTVQ
jgi:hypothetical protein